VRIETTMPPTAPAPGTSPRSPVSIPRERVALSTDTAPNAKLRKFTVAVTSKHERTGEDRPTHRRPASLPCPVGVRRSLGRCDPSEQQGGGHERERVGDQRSQDRERTSRPARAPAGDEGQCPAVVQQRAAVDELGVRHDRHEERSVRDAEDDAEGSHSEGRRCELRVRQRVEGVRDGGSRRPAAHGRGRTRPSTAGRPAESVDPGSGRNGDEQVRQQPRRCEVPHLGGARWRRRGCWPR